MNNDNFCYNTYQRLYSFNKNHNHPRNARRKYCGDRLTQYGCPRQVTVTQPSQGWQKSTCVSQNSAGDSFKNNKCLLDKGFELLKQNKLRTIIIADALLNKKERVPISQYESALILKGRALLLLDKNKESMDVFNKIKYTKNKAFMLSKGRTLQANNILIEAKCIFENLYNDSITDKDIKVHGLALSRCYQRIGNDSSMDQALKILTRLRTLAAKGIKGVPCDDKEIEMALGRHHQEMNSDRSMALAKEIYIQLRASKTSSGQRDIPCNDKDIELALSLHYQVTGGKGNMALALEILIQLRASNTISGKRGIPCNDQKIEMALGRCYQAKGRGGDNNLKLARDIFIRLRAELAGAQGIPCNNNDIEMALGRCYKMIGGDDNMDLAFKIFIRQRALAANGQQDTPCNDKEIELSIGMYYQMIGDDVNLALALKVFTQLYATKSVDGSCSDKEIGMALGRCYELIGGDVNMALAQEVFIQLRATKSFDGQRGTPCNDKEIEMALGRCYEMIGGDANMALAFEVFTQLRATKSFDGKRGTPCNDKEIEMALGRCYKMIGGDANLKLALELFIQLRARYGGGQEIPCNDEAIEIAIGSVYLKLENWTLFDKLELDKKGFTKDKVFLLISIRYYYEFITCNELTINRTLVKALNYGVASITAKGSKNAASYSQVGHCLRLLNVLPNNHLLDEDKKSKLKHLYSVYFGEANEINPSRLSMYKDELWRKQEHDFLEKAKNA